MDIPGVTTMSERQVLKLGRNHLVFRPFTLILSHLRPPERVKYTGIRVEFIIVMDGVRCTFDHGAFGDGDAIREGERLEDVAAHHHCNPRTVTCVRKPMLLMQQGVLVRRTHANPVHPLRLP